MNEIGIYGTLKGYEYYNCNGFTEWDKCIECDVFRVKDSCQHCGEGVCKRKKCCQVFPHKDNKSFGDSQMLDVLFVELQTLIFL